MPRRVVRVEEWKTSGTGFFYQRIADDLCSRIQVGEWAIGGKMPGRQALAHEYGVDLRTMQQAVTSLLRAGVLQAVDRKGTFVARAVQAADYYTANKFPSEEMREQALPNQLSGSPIAHNMKPAIGFVTLGGYIPDDILPDTDHWGNILARAVEQRIASIGGQTHFADIDYSSYVNNPWEELSRKEQVNAVIIADIYGLLDRSPEIVLALEASHMPLVIIGFSNIFTKLPYITYDQHYAGFLAAEHLIQCGYRDIFFHMPFHTEWADERLAGIRTALTRYALPHNAQLICPSSSVSAETDYYDRYRSNPHSQALGILVEDNAAADQFMTFLTSGGRKGIVAINDSEAFAILKLTQAHGLTAGRDYGLVGFDDIWHARRNGLTSIRPPLDAMGDTATRIALSLLRNEAYNQRIILRSQVIVRTSTQATAT